MVQCIAVWCSVSQCVEVCHSVLQCVAVCCARYDQSPVVFSRNPRYRSTSPQVFTGFLVGQVIPKDWVQGVQYKMQRSDTFVKDEICVISRSDGERKRMRVHTCAFMCMC